MVEGHPIYYLPSSYRQSTLQKYEMKFIALSIKNLELLRGWPHFQKKKHSRSSFTSLLVILFPQHHTMDAELNPHSLMSFQP